LSKPNLDCRRRDRNIRKCERMLSGHPALYQQFLEEVVRTLTPEIDEIEQQLNAAIKTYRRGRLKVIDGDRRLSVRRR
jgi:t-SNARE complex subunit (syntaxin)